MCRSVRGGTLAGSRPHVGGVMRCAGVYGRPWRVHARPLLPHSRQALVRWILAVGLLGVAAFLLDWCRQLRSSRRQAAWVTWGASLS